MCRWGFRTFGRNPAFTAVAMVTLALGIGVNAGIFVVVNGVLLRDLPVPGARELVAIQQTVEGGQQMQSTGEGTFSAAGHRAYRDRAQTLTGVIAYSNPAETTLAGDTPQQMLGVLVSCNYFTVLQQPPAIGRALTDRDCARRRPGHRAGSRAVDDEVRFGTRNHRPHDADDRRLSSPQAVLQTRSRARQRRLDAHRV